MSPASDWKEILVAMDFSAPAEKALESAEWLARASGASLTVVHVVESPASPVRALLAREDVKEVEEAWIGHARERLDEVVGGAREQGAVVEGLVRLGTAWEEILAVAEDREVDAIALGASGHSTLERLFLGSTAENVVRGSGVPVLVVRDLPLGEVERVLLPFDFDEGTRTAIGFAREAFEGADLRALHVVAPLPPAEPVTGPFVPDLGEIRTEVQERLEEMGAGGIREEVVLRADPVATILAKARELDADLIVLATHGRRGLRRWFLGSVASKVARHAEVPVLVLPPWKA